eukprot:TRINITY_DN46531_c0_g1_i1.p1 TRINITY_DN46531_c0_g1~~TRINITY_DN46531_c0_g1_i1.p1  ORF type:complete len:331 (-),score=47.13 TRINITY_DN46531_c0_g1_i1:127-1119(-)
MPKRKGNWHDKANKARRWQDKKIRSLDMRPGMTGLCFTINPQQQRSAIHEIKDLLQEYKPKTEESDAQEEEAPSGFFDMSAALAQAVEGMKKKEGQKYTGVQVMETQVKGQMFVALPDPLTTLLTICQNIADTKAHVLKHVSQVLPVQRICKAHMPTIKEQLTEIIRDFVAAERQKQAGDDDQPENTTGEQDTTEQPTTTTTTTTDAPTQPRKYTKISFQPLVKVQCNDGIKKADKELKTLIETGMPNDLFFQVVTRGVKIDVLVFVVVLKNVVCMGIGRDFSRFESYKLQRLAKEKEPSTKGKEPEAAETEPEPDGAREPSGEDDDGLA